MRFSGRLLYTHHDQAKTPIVATKATRSAEIRYQPLRCPAGKRQRICPHTAQHLIQNLIFWNRENIRKKKPNNKKACTRQAFLFDLARRTGLEPATPGVTGRYSNQLSYHRAMHPSARKTWWVMTESNRRHPACKAGALPTELITRRLKDVYYSTSFRLVQGVCEKFFRFSGCLRPDSASFNINPNKIMFLNKTAAALSQAFIGHVQAA